MIINSPRVTVQSTSPEANYLRHYVACQTKLINNITTTKFWVLTNFNLLKKKEDSHGEQEKSSNYW